MNKSGTGGQVISHPTGGGAIKGLGETFAPDLHTGTGNLTVPLSVPPGRSNLRPDLSLAYSSGRGNGVFGFGWSLNLPGVSRDTSQGVPVYNDDEDRFVLSGAEQLVTVDSAAGVTQYRPRTEGVFARIAHHVSQAGDFWEVRSRNGLVSTYTPSVRNPDDARRIFSWQLTKTSDPFKNVLLYEYEKEAQTEQGPHRWDQSYLKTIRYADYGSKDAPEFLISVDFIYETRPDPFSSYRSGFEIRTTRRCAGIEVYTHAGDPKLAATYRFAYQDGTDTPSLLRRIQLEGVDGALREALPPLDFSYTQFEPTRRRYFPLGTSSTVPERSLNHPDFELADLFGRGLPDVVQIGDVNRYWRNLGNGRFDTPRPLEGLLSGVRLGQDGTQLADFDGDGQIDLLVSRPGLNGYVALTVLPSSQVRPFVSSQVAPPFEFNDPELRLMDLDGDGITDALRTGTQFELYFHDRFAGWSRTEVRARDDFDRFPNVFFSDPRVKLADMTGDGLQDIVFVDNGRIDYWPYMGNGKWGARISMTGDIRFPDASAFGGIGFDPKRVLLGDIDGDGVADLVYVESGRITIWMNQSGNGWSDPMVIYGTPPVTDVDAVRLVDMLGTGTAGVLWTYDEATFADSTYKFLDLTGGTKPYLLHERKNNAGARTLVEFAPSTRFYLEDERLPETRWQGRLPFPVQVVARVEAIDQLSQGKLTTEYRYHQGYWDGDEREFRGFGIVEQIDTETFALYGSQGLHGGQSFSPVDPTSFSPPTLTRTFFHQGEVQDSAGNRKEGDFSTSGWTGDPDLFQRAQSSEFQSIAKAAALEGNPARVRHALRAIRGSVLRSEFCALDSAPNQDRPYTVTESLFDVREIQPGDPGIYFPFRIANRTTNWERGNDPMTRVTFTADYDEYGFPHSQLAIAVPRGRNPLLPLDSPLEPYLASRSLTEFARRDDDQLYIVDRVSHTTSHEVLNDGRPSVFELRDTVSNGTAQLQIIGHSRSYYDGDAFLGLPIGQIGDFGVSVRRETLAFQDDFLETAFGGSIPPYLTQADWTADYPVDFQTVLPGLAGYVRYTDAQIPGLPGGYFITTDRRSCDFHDPALIPRGRTMVARDSLGSDTAVTYDSFDLFAVQVTDPVGLATQAQYDYRVLQPSRITDPNGNIAEFRFSPSGMLVAQFVRGKNGEGDAAHPSMRVEYDLLAFLTRGQPISARTIRRVHHDSETEVPLPDRDATIELVQYSDGLGRLLQTRVQAEDTLFGDPIFGGSALPSDQFAAVPASAGRTRAPGDPLNVIVSGWQVYDNKGQVVERYEPFFAQGFDFNPPLDSQFGRKAVLFYDPRGQAIRTVNPDGSELLLVLGIPVDITDPSQYTPTPWETYIYDANDNAGRTHPSAAASYSNHWNTPAGIVVDALGRTVKGIARNGQAPEDLLTTETAYDIRGNPLRVTGALGRTVFEYVFDLTNRRWRMDSMDAGRRVTIPDAAGNTIEARDSKGSLILQSYDAAHRLVSVWARDDSSSAIAQRQRFEYGDDLADRESARSLNLLGQIARHHDEAGLVTVDSVDFKGNILEKTRRVIADGPILSVFHSTPANQWNIAPFQVDWQPTGQESVSDLEAALLEPDAYVTSATYDAVGRVKQMQLPQDVQGHRALLRPIYNGAGGLEQVWLDDALYVERIAYDAKGQRALIALGNGVMTRYAYDPDTLRLLRLRSERYTQTDSLTYAPAGEVLQDFAYDSDLSGNILSIRDVAPGSGVLNNPDAASADAALAQLLAGGDALLRTFSYDPLYRLLAAKGRECDHLPENMPAWFDAPRCSDLTKARLYTETYQYDKMGSLLRLEHHNATGGYVRQFSVEAQNNRLRTLQTGQDAFTYSFDSGGNMIAETSSRHFEYNHADQMKVFRTQTDGAEPSVYAQYLYDTSGQRVKKLVRKQGGQFETTHYLDGIFEHHCWSSAQTCQNNTIHIMDDKQRVALVRVGPASPGDTAPPIQFQLGDHLRSSNVVVDAAGALVNREEFLPYGETSFGDFAKKRYRFTGMERDEESGLNYHGARYYSPWLARWGSCDPLGLAAGTNAYLYCNANPINNSDPSGLDSDQLSPQDQQLLEWANQSPIYLFGTLDDLELAYAAGTANMTTQAQDEAAFAAQENAQMNDYTHVQQQIEREMAAEDPDLARDLNERWKQRAAKHYSETHGSELAHLEENYRRIDAAAGAVNEIIAFELMGVSTAVGIGTAGGVIAFGKGVGFSALLAGATSNGGYEGCGRIAGLAPLPSAASGELVGGGASTATRSFEDEAGETTWLTGGTGKAFAGHGIETAFVEPITVPPGTTVIAPPAGYELPESMGQAMEAGRWWELAAHPDISAQVQAGQWRTFGPGSTMPNLVLYPNKGASMYVESITVSESTVIGDLLKPDMGCMFWAACTAHLGGR